MKVGIDLNILPRVCKTNVATQPNKFGHRTPEDGRAGSQFHHSGTVICSWEETSNDCQRPVSLERDSVLDKDEISFADGRLVRAPLLTALEEDEVFLLPTLPEIVGQTFHQVPPAEESDLLVQVVMVRQGCQRTSNQEVSWGEYIGSVL